MMCEGIGFTVASFISVPLSKYIPRQTQILFSIMVLGANAAGWLLWQPEEGQIYIVFIISFIYGSVHGVFRTLVAGNVIVNYHFDSTIFNIHICTHIWSPFDGYFGLVNKLNMQMSQTSESSYCKPHTSVLVIKSFKY